MEKECKGTGNFIMREEVACFEDVLPPSPARNLGIGAVCRDVVEAM